MHVLRLKISDKVFDKVIWLLGKFNKDEIQIVDDNEEFLENQKYLHQEYSEVEAGKATFINIKEAEERLENVIKKHEDRS